MRILIVAATHPEIDTYRATNPGLDYLVTGVGVPATIFHLTRALAGNKYGLVIQAGIAGNFNEEAVGELSIVQADRFADLGIYENGSMYSLDEKKIADNEFPFDVEGWLVNPHAGQWGSLSIPLVKAITVNTVTDDSMQNSRYEKKWQPAIESMEGAAMHYCCLHYKIPFVQIRATSNRVGERDRSQWDIPGALKNLHEGINNIIVTAKNISF